MRTRNLNVGDKNFDFGEPDYGKEMNISLPPKKVPDETKTPKNKKTNALF